MKKLLLVLTVCMCAWSASAQNWAVGGRIGSGFMADVQYVFSNDNYIEGRFGAYWANAGGKGHYAYVGAAGCAKLGIDFSGAPVRLSFDWSPAFGPGIAYWDGDSASEFNEHALCNFGITCSYRF